MHTVLAEDFGTGQVLWSFLYFTLFFIWIWLLITVFADIFRSPDLSGWGKALWSIFVIFLPYLGVFVYLIARGHKMTEHRLADAQTADAATRAYIRDAAGGGGVAGELEKLASLRDRGVISDEEFAAQKARLIS